MAVSTDAPNGKFEISKEISHEGIFSQNTTTKKYSWAPGDKNALKTPAKEAGWNNNDNKYYDSVNNKSGRNDGQLKYAGYVLTKTKVKTTIFGTTTKKYLFEPNNDGHLHAKRRSEGVVELNNVFVKGKWVKTSETTENSLFERLGSAFTRFQAALRGSSAQGPRQHSCEKVEIAGEGRPHLVSSASAPKRGGAKAMEDACRDMKDETFIDRISTAIQQLQVVADAHYPTVSPVNASEKGSSDNSFANQGPFRIAVGDSVKNGYALFMTSGTFGEGMAYASEGKLENSQANVIHLAGFFVQPPIKEKLSIHETQNEAVANLREKHSRGELFTADECKALFPKDGTFYQQQKDFVLMLVDFAKHSPKSQMPLDSLAKICPGKAVLFDKYLSSLDIYGQLAADAFTGDLALFILENAAGIFD